MKPRAVLAAVAALWMVLLLGGCIRAKPVLMPEYTPPPEAAPTPEITPTPEPTLTPQPTPEAGEDIDPLHDALGEWISGVDHYKQYLEFKNIQVYEQCDDTFVDAVVVNTYPQRILCAASVSFTEEEETVAAGKLQTRDGQYALALEPGETTVFAQIDTDMGITALDYRIEYDETLGVMPG